MGNRGEALSEQRKKRRRKKSKARKLLEYGVVRALLPLPRLIPLKAIHLLSSLLGNLLYSVLTERRKIALQNLQMALGTEKTEQEIKRIARESCKSFLLTCFETVKYQPFFKADDARDAIKGSSTELEALFQKAKNIHEASGGCIFVTPHLGNWEFLPYVSFLVGIPLVVVVRSMKNEYLERLIYRNRADSGQIIIHKKNALFALQKTLRQGKSIGILPDQSTRQGIGVHFFGRKAWTTPAPALLSIMYQKPIVVVACCRKEKSYDFVGIVSDPIRPGPFQSEKEEIFRLTEEMNKTMETVIRKYPEQYFWIHDRWKAYRSHREFLR
jgi:Kdo2-lipid IVA lauroyltransferase/acyltransferase